MLAVRMFRVGLFLACIGPTIIATCVPAFADALCVQQGLARIGLDPGPIDGKLGAKTLRAAKTYQAGAMYLPELDAVTSYIWCRSLRGQPPSALNEAGELPNELFATSGSASAIGATPILGQTPEYEVPKWVNNPH
jgi:hypothetical protein